MTQFPDIRFRKYLGPERKVDWFEITEDCDVHGFFIIPAGYTSDLASVPRWLWSLFPPHGLMTNAAVVHDYMYDNRLFEEGSSEEMARDYADKLFAHNCIFDGVPVWQVFIIHSIIRLFGRSWWIK